MRLVTYNIHKGIGGGDRRYKLDRIVDVLAELDADCVCLQEVTVDLPRTRRHDQVGILAERFKPMTSIFQQNVKWRVGGYGNMVLSRWPVREQHRIALRFQQKRPRGAQLLVIDTPVGKLRLVNWHLGLSERERHWQVTKLLHHETFRATAARPTIIAGDFNDWRNVLDQPLLAAHGFRQVTTPPRRFRSFPAMMPVMALDKVFHHGGITIDAIKVWKNKLTRQASDHLPVVLDFRLSDGG